MGDSSGEKKQTGVKRKEQASSMPVVDGGLRGYGEIEGKRARKQGLWDTGGVYRRGDKQRVQVLVKASFR